MELGAYTRNTRTDSVCKHTWVLELVLSGPDMKQLVLASFFFVFFLVGFAVVFLFVTEV